jgi:hypothetical protein
MAGRVIPRRRGSYGIDAPFAPALLAGLVVLYLVLEIINALPWIEPVGDVSVSVRRVPSASMRNCGKRPAGGARGPFRGRGAHGYLAT